MGYQADLSARKLRYRTAGWIENTNRHRCGNYWAHSDYPDQKFSIYEVEKLITAKIRSKVYEGIRVPIRKTEGKA